MQALGSAITYVRRYRVVGLLALVAEDDDDGSAASGQLIRRRAVAASTNGHAPEPDVITGTGRSEAPESRPVTIPADAGLPCGGQVIADLKPAQRAMLVSKTAALQAERAGRLPRGQRRPGTPVNAPTPEGPPPAIAVASGPVL